VAAYTDPNIGRVARQRTTFSDVGLWLALEVALIVIVLAVLRLTVAGVVVAVVVALAAAALVVPLRGNTVVQWVQLHVAFRSRRRHRALDPDVPPSLVPLAEWVPDLAVVRTLTGRGGEVGVITDGTAWVAVLALLTDDELIADSGEEIDLSSLASLTVQDDVAFDGVQLVTYTVPAPTGVLLGEGSPAAASYREILGSVPPPPTVRRTWLCVRLDPRTCLGAVARRGVGTEGINATLRFGLHRAQSVLKRQGIETRALDPVEIYEVLALTSGAGPEAAERTSEEWSTWRCDGLDHRGLLVSNWGDNPTRAYANLLDALSEAPVLFAVTSFTLSQQKRASGAIRLACPTASAADHAADEVAARLTGVRLRPAGGRQVPAMLATVPFGRGA
jgi:type VII secretion protein EccE